MSNAASITIALETDYTPDSVQALADVKHRFKDIARIPPPVHLRQMAWLFALLNEKH